MTVRDWLAAASVDASWSTVCVNGDYWLRGDWDREIPHGALVHVEARAGHGGGSNPLAIILQVAVLAAAVFVPGAGWGLALTGWQAAAAGMAISIGGSLLVNAIVPTVSASSSVTGTTTSPTYSLQSSGNSARLLDSMPAAYGRMKLTPDLASQPYTEYSDNDQYLYELFCITQGELAIESILIGDTPIANFSEIDYEIVGPNQAVTLFPDNVVTSAEVGGIELQAPNDSGDWVGPFTANPAGTKANFIGIDLTLPSGLFYANDNGSLGSLALTYEVQARQIDDAGNATSDWIGLDARELKMATSQPQQVSYRYPVTAARYEVRARRTTNLNTDSRAQNRVQWAGMRAYLPSERYYGDCTLLALRARATNNLNSSTAHQVYVIGTRKLPVWNGTSWSDPQPTRSIAWAFADACRNTTYGGGLADKRVDLETLLELDAIWSARGDQFNGVFDTKGTFWDALTTIAAAGRAVPMYFASVVSIVRDELKTARTIVFTPDNSIPSSFAVSYAFYAADTPDHVVIQYLDEQTWGWQEVACIPTGSPALVPSTIKMVGVTNRTQAWREGIYKAYANRDQRKQITLSTELEGFIPRFGDLVGISHDLPQWGISGTVDGQDDSMVMVDQQLEWTEGAQHYVYFIWPDGSPTGALRVSKPDSGDDMSMALVDALPAGFVFSDGFSYEATRFCFGPGIDRAMLDARVISIVPGDNGQVDLTFVNAADSPHLAETQQSPPGPVSPSSLPGIIHAPIVTEIAVDWKIVPGNVTITAAPAAGAALYEFQSSANGGASWAKLGTSTGNTISVPIAVGDWMFRVRAYGASGLGGPYATWTGSVTEFVYPPAAPSLSLRDPFTGDQLSIEIQRLQDVDFYDIDVMVGGAVKYSAEITAQNFTWTLEQAQQYGAIADTFDVRVTAGNVAGMGTPATITVKSTPPAMPTVTVTPGVGGLATLYMSSNGAVKATGFVVRQGADTVFDGAGPTCEVTAGNSYDVTAYNAWHSESAARTVDVSLSDGESSGSDNSGPGGGT
ncbi:host specificity factor TipJ family phage tail protein [Paraburkholderia sp. BR10872]|uniref:host specificity factor TipJ family phage tail protein n=1 Tax=Paraburkholderia sp. BR10872 TaxID=3236989 RepID=UPI0034D1E2A2